jgi:repressor LexA
MNPSHSRPTPKQGQYLAFIYNYAKINGRPPAQADMQRHFRVAAPTVHQMILKLESEGFIRRTPGVARSLELTVDLDFVPRLE